MLKRSIMMSVAFLATFALIHSVQAADDNGSLNSKDAKFVRNVATGGMLEVEIGQYIADKSSNSDVKMFGQHMVTDHSKANDELKQLAVTKNVDLKDANDKEQKEAAKMKTKYDKLSGLELDKAYMKDMVKDHEEDVKEFEKAAEVTLDPDLKTWAAKTLPTLQDHLKMAKDIEEKLEKTAG
jgi:putative membrane protein